MNTLTEISSFLERFKDFSKYLERQKVIYYKAKFDGLLSGYDSLIKLISKFNEREAIDYNIFDILNIKTAEVKTHTPFLRNLLNPNGTHGQRDLFLSSFIHRFIPKEKQDYFFLSNKNDYVIEEEKSINNGRIDIYLHSLNLSKKFGIIIENKLFAGDQYLQLNRYYDFIKRKKYEDYQMMLFYLSVYGNPPSTHSIDNKLKTELEMRNILFNLSYKIDIKNWLSDLITNIKADKVRSLVEQYLKIIEKL